MRNSSNYKELNEGRTQLMKNGQYAIILTYRSFTDIDVVFEDGTIVEHKSLQKFNQGNIENPEFVTVANNMSTPETIIFTVLKHFFPDLVRHYKPDDNQYWGTSNIDMYIPSLNMGIEVDEYATHRKDLPRFQRKEELVKNSKNIAILYTFAERGCLNRDYAMNYIINLKNDSHNFSSNVVTDEYKASYFIELEAAINWFLRDNGIFNEEACLTREMIEDVMSKNRRIKTYEEYMDIEEMRSVA